MEAESHGKLNNNCAMKEDLKEIFKNVNDWLKFAETKNAMLLGFNSALLVGVFKVFADDKNLKDLLIFVGPYYHYVFPILIIISIIILLLSFIPETKMINLSSGAKPEKINTLFYSHLETLTPDQLLKELGAEEPEKTEGIERAYAQQIIINAGIAARKFDTFKFAGWTTISALLLVFPAIFLLGNYLKKRVGKKEIK
jgi:hypothetical protein